MMKMGVVPCLAHLHTLQTHQKLLRHVHSVLQERRELPHLIRTLHLALPLTLLLDPSSVSHLNYLVSVSSS